VSSTGRLALSLARGSKAPIPALFAEQLATFATWRLSQGSVKIKNIYFSKAYHLFIFGMRLAKLPTFSQQEGNHEQNHRYDIDAHRSDRGMWVVAANTAAIEPELQQTRRIYSGIDD
jgi:hypothetical protein